MNIIFMKCINRFSDLIRFNRIVKCQANNIDPKTMKYTIKCSNYCDGKKYNYCKKHIILMKLFCEKYHFIDKNYNNINMSLLAKIELNMRHQYKERFNLITDTKHQKWLKHLQFLSNNLEYSRYHTVRNLHNIILYETIDYDFLDFDYEYHLFISEKFKNNKKNNQIPQFEINLSKYKINLEYFLNNQIYDYKCSEWLNIEILNTVHKIL